MRTPLREVPPEPGGEHSGAEVTSDQGGEQVRRPAPSEQSEREVDHRTRYLDRSQESIILARTNVDAFAAVCIRNSAAQPVDLAPFHRTLSRFVDWCWHPATRRCVDHESSPLIHGGNGATPRTTGVKSAGSNGRNTSLDRSLLTNGGNEPASSQLSSPPNGRNEQEGLSLRSSGGNSEIEECPACLALRAQPMYYCGILASWRLGKTLMGPVRMMAFEIGQNLDTRGRFVSSNDVEAMDRTMLVRKIIESPEYRMVFPHVIPDPTDWAKHSFTVKHPGMSTDPTLRGSSVASGAAGTAADILWFDDVVTKRNSVDHAVERPRVASDLQDVWLRRIDPHSRVGLIGTTWHVDDAHNQLRRQNDGGWAWLMMGPHTSKNYLVGMTVTGAYDEDAWTHVRKSDETTTHHPSAPRSFPAGRTFTLPLWKKRGRDWLVREHRKGAWAYVRGFEISSPTVEDRLFSDLTGLLVPGRVQDYVPPEVRCLYYGGYDIAGTTRPGNGLVSVCEVPGRARKVIVGIDKWRGSFKEDASRLLAANARFHYSLLEVENNGVQQTLVDAYTGFPALAQIIQGFHTGSNKADPVKGIRGMETSIRNGAWALCMDDPYETGLPLNQHDPECECAYHEFIMDLNTFSFGSKERPYDLMMAFWFAWYAANGMADVLALENAAAQEPEEDLGLIPVDEIGGYLF